MTVHPDHTVLEAAAEHRKAIQTALDGLLVQDTVLRDVDDLIDLLTQEVNEGDRLAGLLLEDDHIGGTH